MATFANFSELAAFITVFVMLQTEVSDPDFRLITTTTLTQDFIYTVVSFTALTGLSLPLAGPRGRITRLCSLFETISALVIEHTCFAVRGSAVADTSGNRSAFLMRDALPFVELRKSGLTIASRVLHQLSLLRECPKDRA